ncbi:MAG TPA: hypothetical protein VM364_15275 [Vicinamibacterales bacterium]|nr:hypothetical protein [Vicinamibacterales bacterium]
MKRLASATLVAAFVLVLLVVLVGAGPGDGPRLDTPVPAPPTLPSPTDGSGFLFGRVTTGAGTTYTGRLRFGRDQEAFWGDYFNGLKHRNPWAEQAPAARPAQRRPSFSLFGFEFPFGPPPDDTARPFMARFGDIARIEARGRDLRVTLKSGTVIPIAWGAANDVDDGVRVWDDERGVVDLASWAGGLPPAAHVRIRTIELLPTGVVRAVPARLHGTVRTGAGEFSGFIQWNRKSGVSTDEFSGRGAEGLVRLRFDAIRSIVRHTGASARVTLLDGRELVLAGSRDTGEGHNGIYVDDRRYGRVLVSWGAFERVDFSAAAGSGPAYAEFPPGRPLTGTVTTRAGQRLSGRLVYDLDESETTETLDAPAHGVDYTIPFGLVASIAPGEHLTAPASVRLHSGETLRLESAGDLGAGNGGVLVFVEGGGRPEYVPWPAVARIDFDRPPATFPPLQR